MRLARLEEQHVCRHVLLHAVPGWRWLAGEAEAKGCGQLEGEGEGWGEGAVVGEDQVQAPDGEGGEQADRPTAGAQLDPRG